MEWDAHKEVGKGNLWPKAGGLWRIGVSRFSIKLCISVTSVPRTSPTSGRETILNGFELHKEGKQW